MKVFHFHRKPAKGHHSIESLFSCLRQEILANGITVEHKEMPWHSQGILPRLRGILWARRNQGGVNHITGDVHFLALGLDKNRTVLTIHDLEMLSSRRGIKRWLLKLFWFDLPLACVARVTVISEATKKELIRICGVDTRKVTVIPDAVSLAFEPGKDREAMKPYRVLQIGTKSNKNLLRLFEALRGLSCHLTVVGRLKDTQREALHRLQIGYSNLVDLSETEIVAQYHQADLVTVVSTKEGFGMPILEAQWVERPVVASNVSSLPEVAGDGACFVDPYCVDSIRAGIERTLTDSEFRRSIIEAGRINRKRFTVPAVAQRYIQVYQEMLTALND